MKKKRNKKRNHRHLLLFLIALIFSFCICAAAIRKPDWIFLFKEQMASLFRSAPLKELSADDLLLEEFTKEELLSDPEHCTCGTTLLLVNQEHPISRDYTASLVSLSESRDGTLSLDSAAVSDFNALSDDVLQACGTSLLIRSSYRTYEEQAAEKEAQPAIAAAAGTSEHETGLALDVYVPYYAGYGFLKSEAGQYVYTHSWENGFIIRYPYGKEDLTGIPFEPWHLRYVGCPHAEIMYKNSWTLEEYLNHLEIGAFYQFGEYFISRQNGETILLPGNTTALLASDDNCGSLVIWGTLHQQNH
ncbi:MAG: M15 family metallopeptidase [Fusicatenibacter sp.]|nr:M15 family metallopeptidase [Lachnospiraceae bacterium]MDY2937969.1 M15 family metallopeptidase [Fusicatenibacter sp.]